MYFLRYAPKVTKNANKKSYYYDIITFNNTFRLKHRPRIIIRYLPSNKFYDKTYGSQNLLFTAYISEDVHQKPQKNIKNTKEITLLRHLTTLNDIFVD